MYNVVVRLKIDNAAIKAKIDKAIANSSSIKRVAYNKAYGIFKSARRAMLREFDRHPVTQEILAGPQGTNISGTLDGYGNLFSFIGFHEGDHPIEPLRALLEQGTTFEQTIYRKGSWYFRISLPSKLAIEEATPMPWEGGNSWAYAVESYISGLSHYMYKQWNGANSRSGMGLQLPYENWGGDLNYSGREYITEILRTFRERINKDKE